jgi:hypothetical protein
MKTSGIGYRLLTAILRVALVLGLCVSGWIIYSKLPSRAASESRPGANSQTIVQIVLIGPVENGSDAIAVSVELYPFDIVAARHEYFTERRAGKRFDDFLNERMKGRAPIATQLDAQGKTSVTVPAGTWWLHAVLPGDENLEWRLPVNVAGVKQTVELTPQNIYTRTKSF